MFIGLYIVVQGYAGWNSIFDSSCVIMNCVIDFKTFDSQSSQQNCSHYGCEYFSSTASSGGSRYAIHSNGMFVMNCNIHDTIGGGIFIGNSAATIMSNIIAKCHGDGINDVNGGLVKIIGNTIDGNTGNGITEADAISAGQQTPVIFNNIISNNTGAGKYGVSFTTAGAAIFDYNVYYNNTADINGSSGTFPGVTTYGPHDTHGGSNPYVGQSTENYTLA